MAATLGSDFERASLLYCYKDWVALGPEQWARLPKALHVFTDIEFLSGNTASQAAALHAFLSERGPVLNHPSRSLKRLPLHRLLYSRGINRFRSFAVDKFRMEQLKFPVFLRRANDHRGSRSPLLTSADALGKQIDELRRRGRSMNGWIVTEFCETADASGLRHKFAAFCIGEAIVPRHVFFSEQWVIKEAQRVSPALLEQERTYLKTNPHEEALRQVFELAGIQYGRVDYSLVNGRPQVWEINTNPVIFRPSQWWGPRSDHHRLACRQIEQAWRNLDALSPVRGRARLQRWKTYPDLVSCFAREAFYHLRAKRIFRPEEA
ncbi:MAG: hypothetical protein ACT4PZ_07815 [Panacagrimonas sp.]